MALHHHLLRRAAAAIAVMPLVATACGDDDNPPFATTAVTPIESGTTPFDVNDTTPYGTIDTTPLDTVPVDQVPPTGQASAHSNPAGPVQIDVRVGTDSGPDRVEIVQKGSEVQLNITNPSADDEFHIHGYDLEQDVPKGNTATFNFVAGQVGSFEVESHETENVLVVIEVR